MDGNSSAVLCDAGMFWGMKNFYTKNGGVVALLFPVVIE